MGRYARARSGDVPGPTSRCGQRARARPGPGGCLSDCGHVTAVTRLRSRGHGGAPGRRRMAAARAGGRDHEKDTDASIASQSLLNREAIEKARYGQGEKIRRRQSASPTRQGLRVAAPRARGRLHAVPESGGRVPGPRGPRASRAAAPCKLCNLCNLRKLCNLCKLCNSVNSVDSVDSVTSVNSVTL